MKIYTQTFSGLLALIFSFQLFIGNGCNWETENPAKDELILNLQDEWKFSIGDDIEWKGNNFNDKNWEKINVPSQWENEGYHGYDGFAWYRKHFKLDSDLKNNSLYLNLGFIDDADQTYLNGKLIGVSGSLPPYYQTAYNANRKYFLPNQLLIYNSDNVIAVRIYDDQLEGGITSGDIGIYALSSSVSLDVNLTGQWKFMNGDNERWAATFLKDSMWHDVFVPAHWENQGFFNYDGYGWYRKSFILPSELKNKNLILLLGKIDDVDQTFLNGKLIGTTGNFNLLPEGFNSSDPYLKLRAYPIVSSDLFYDKPNVIAVRVYDGFRDGGIYDGPIGLITKDKFTKYYKEFLGR